MFKILIDTSVFGFALENSSSEKVQATKDFLKLIGHSRKVAVFLSHITISELENTPGKELRENLFVLLEKFSYTVIGQSENIENLAQEYLKKKIIPEKYINDARLIAAAVVAGIPIIVTWNLKHMANIIVKRAVNSINLLFGYSNVDIVTPMEFDL